MDGSDQIWMFLRTLLQQLPSILTLIGCIAFAMSRWKRHPKVSLFAIVSLVLLLLHGIIFAAVYVWVPSWLIQGREPGTSIQSIMTMLGLIYNIALAIGFGLLLVTVFMQRAPAVQKS